MANATMNAEMVPIRSETARREEQLDHGDAENDAGKHQWHRGELIEQEGARAARTASQALSTVTAITSVAAPAASPMFSKRGRDKTWNGASGRSFPR